MALSAKFTAAPSSPDGAETVISWQPRITGAMVSRTVIVCVQVVMFPAASVALYVRVIIFGQVPAATSLTCTTTGAGVQLSVAITAAGLGAGTSASHCTANAAGQAIAGGCVSWTVTVNEQLATPATFEAVHVTVVAPMGKEFGEVITVEPTRQVTVGAGFPVAVGANATERAHWLGALFVVMFAGQVMAGGVLVVVVELTVTVKLQELMLAEASRAVHVTVVVPTGNDDPDGGAQLAVTPGQLSAAVGAAKLTIAMVWPAGTLVTTFAGQTIAGGSVSLTVTVNEQLAPLAVVQLTIVVPTGKKPPDGSTQVTVPQFPVVVGGG